MRTITMHKRAALLYSLSLILVLCFTSGCATPAKNLPPQPQPYVHKESDLPKPADGSLWVDSASLFEDRRARRLNDLVTINIFEKISGSNKAETSTGKETSYDAGIDNFFGAKPPYKNLGNFWGSGNPLKPTIKASAKNSFDGTGESVQEGNLTGTITAKVIAVQPNGNLVIDSRKEITLNNEKQILVLQGIIRPEDISSDNSISSLKVADAKLYFVGDGIITEKQSPGWLGRMVDQVWPF